MPLKPEALRIGNWIFNKDKFKPVQVGYSAIMCCHADVQLYNESFRAVVLDSDVLLASGFTQSRKYNDLFELNSESFTFLYCTSNSKLKYKRKKGKEYMSIYLSSVHQL